MPPEEIAASINIYIAGPGGSGIELSEFVIFGDFQSTFPLQLENLRLMPQLATRSNGLCHFSRHPSMPASPNDA
jgi:hypothetical protein